jgi:hypothetical protein
MKFLNKTINNIDIPEEYVCEVQLNSYEVVELISVLEHVLFPKSGYKKIPDIQTVRHLIGVFTEVERTR